MSNADGAVALDARAGVTPARDSALADADRDEAQQLRLARAGDEVAFTALYRRHRAAVYRYAWLVCGSESHAADVTQDVFVEILSASNRFDPARGSLAAYLCGIARFRAYRVAERGTHSTADIEAALEACGDSYELSAPELPLEQLQRSRALQALYSAIRKLPAPFRDVLILIELQQMSYADAAAITGIEIGTVRSRLSRAKAKLAQMLNEGECND